MNLAFRGGLPLAAAFCLLAPLTAAAQDSKAKLPGPVGATSYMPVTSEKTFDDVFAAMSARKAEVMGRQRALLEQRYDLADRPATGVTMSRGKPVQGGVRVKLHGGVTWRQLAALTPDEIRSQKLLSGRASCRCRIPIHEEGGMVFPETHIQRDPGAGEARPRALRRRFRPAGSPHPGVSAGDLPHDAPRSRRRLAGRARHDPELLRALQRHPQPEAARRAAAARHAVPAAAVQPDGRPPQRRAEHRRHLLRLPRQRPHERGDPPGRRHPPAGVPPPHRHADPARREPAAAVRLPARAARRSRTSPSSSSAPPTSTATP